MLHQAPCVSLVASLLSVLLLSSCGPVPRIGPIRAVVDPAGELRWAAVQGLADELNTFSVSRVLYGESTGEDWKVTPLVVPAFGASSHNGIWPGLRFNSGGEPEIGYPSSGGRRLLVREGTWRLLAWEGSFPRGSPTGCLWGENEMSVVWNKQDAIINHRTGAIEFVENDTTVQLPSGYNHGFAARSTGEMVVATHTFDDSVLRLVFFDKDNGVTRELPVGSFKTGYVKNPIAVVPRGMGAQETIDVLIATGSDEVTDIRVMVASSTVEKTTMATGEPPAAFLSGVSWDPADELKCTDYLSK